MRQSIRRRDRIGPSSNEEPDPEQELPHSPQAMRRRDPFMYLNIGLRGVDAKGGDPPRSKLENAVMDIMMPQMDAYHGGAIARSPCFGWLPIIVLAAKATKDGREKCRGAGAPAGSSDPTTLDNFSPRYACGCTADQWLP